MISAPTNSYAAKGLALPPRRDLPLQAAAPKPAAPIAADLTTSLGRYLRPQAAYRWLLPSVAAITPQYIEMTLRGALAGNHLQAWELFDLMLDTWPELASCTHEFTDAVLDRQLVVNPSCDCKGDEISDDAQRRQKVVKAAFRRMRPDITADENDLRGTIKDILSAYWFGQVVLETNWDSAYGTEDLNLINAGELGQIIAPRSTFWVHPVCYAWDMNGRLGLRSELGNGYRDVTRNAKSAGVANLWNSTAYQPRPSDITPFPEHKFIIGIHKAKSGTALGGAMLRPLAWWWCAANFSADWLLNLAQLFGIPFRWVTYDPSLPDPLKADLDAMLQNMGSSGWARFPNGTQMNFLEAGKGADNSPQDALLDRCDRYARMLILGQTMSGSQDASKGGGKAFGGVEADVKTRRVDAGCEYVCSVLQNSLVRSIVQLNFNDDANLPELCLADERTGSLEDANILSALANAGLKIPVSHVRTKFEIPAPADDEETIGGQAAATPHAEPDGDEAAEDDKQDDTKELNAASSGEPSTINDQLSTVLHESLLPLLNRLQKIASIEHADIQHDALQKLLADFPAIAAAIKADNSLAKKLSPVLEQSLLAGLNQKS